MTVHSATTRPELLKVRLLPAEEAHDFDYWAERLANPALLRDAVAVAIYRIPLLAVPVGAERRGGQLHVLEDVYAQQTVRALSGRPGFPGLSQRGAVVEWGGRPPVHCGLRERQQFYGLRAQAADTANSINVSPRSPGAPRLEGGLPATRVGSARAGAASIAAVAAPP